MHMYAPGMSCCMRMHVIGTELSAAAIASAASASSAAAMLSHELSMKAASGHAKRQQEHRLVAGASLRDASGVAARPRASCKP